MEITDESMGVSNYWGTRVRAFPQSLRICGSIHSPEYFHPSLYPFISDFIFPSRCISRRILSVCMLMVSTDICRDIETRNRHLSIILSKILAEDEKAKHDEEEVIAATAKRFPSAYIVPELDFFSASSPPSCAYNNLEAAPTSSKGDAAKSSNNQAPDGVDGTAGAQLPKKKSRSILRRAINGLRKSFSRRPSTRV